MRIQSFKTFLLEAKIDSSFSHDFEFKPNDRGGYSSTPITDWSHPIFKHPEIIQAAKDWGANRAYLAKGGNFRLKPVDSDGTILAHGVGSGNASAMAPWNKAVKAAFGSHGWDVLHQFAKHLGCSKSKRRAD